MLAAASVGLVAGCRVIDPPPLGPHPDDVVRHAAATPRPWPGPCRSTTVADVGRFTVDARYDDRGRRVEELTRHATAAGEVRQTRTRWYHDDTGRRSLMVVSDAEGRRFTRYLYDLRGVLVAELVGDVDGKLVRRHERHYDDAGRLVARVTIDPWTDEILDRRELHYDARGRFEGELRWWPDQPREWVSVSVDAEGRVVRRRSDPGLRGVWDSVERYDYDLAGRLTRVAVERAGAPVESSWFTYDPAGNLLRAETFEGGAHLSSVTDHDYACWTANTP